LLKNRLFPPWLGPVLLLCLLVGAPGALAQSPPAATKPTVPPEAPRQCPPPGTLDCMPIVPPERRAFCSRDYAEWIGRNCPNTHIVY